MSMGSEDARIRRRLGFLSVRCLLGFFVLVFIGRAHAAGASPVASAAPTGACAKPGQTETWDFANNAAALATATCQWEAARVLLVGEVHGTEQSPELVGRLITAEAARHPVVLALERSDAEAAAIDAYLASKGTHADQVALTDTPAWSPGEADGRSSEAVLTLIDTVRKLRQTGRAVSIVLMLKHPTDPSVLKQPGGLMKFAEQSMADTVRTALQSSSPDTLVVALMGNYHARIPSDGPYGASAAGHLADLSPVVAFVDGNGSAWDCMNNECGVHPVHAGIAAFLMGDAAARKSVGATTLVTATFPLLSASLPALDVTHAKGTDKALPDGGAPGKDAAAKAAATKALAARISAT